ncbi:hypothetical protein HQ865_24570 [Mucilaginibacter mali]|uniref:Lipoprotein n=1 Tax=Mucilaginibacter mali TaxID=2740462 RepID=A0A7D4TY13_9SPHI|nr:hypothetical protein [Mucilaginibacter mali]QKJ32795.1 hypothetical protein HQ865_24570 [Mucilaginibacter mali]
MRYLLFLTTAILLLSCKRPNPAANTISKITLARSGAWSFYGDAMCIDSTLAYHYLKNTGSRKQLYYQGKISQAFWDSLNRHFDAIKYQTIPDSTSMGGQDMIFMELVIRYNGRKKRIIRIYHDTSAVVKVSKWIKENADTIRLVPLNKPVFFETTYQNPPPIPPLPLNRIRPPHAKTGY